MAKDKWYVVPEQASEGARFCVMFKDTVIVTTPGNSETDKYMADHIVSGMLLVEDMGCGLDLAYRTRG